MDLLDMKQPLFFRSSFNRPNIRYSVVEKHSQKNKSKEELVAIIKKSYENYSGIVYCSTKKCSEEIAEYL